MDLFVPEGLTSRACSAYERAMKALEEEENEVKWRLEGFSCERCGVDLLFLAEFPLPLWSPTREHLTRFVFQQAGLLLSRDWLNL